MIALIPYKSGDETLFLEWFKDDAVGMKFLESYSRPSEWIHLVDRKNIFLYIAHINGNAVGFFDFELNGKVGHFVIYLSESNRGKGISKEILKEAYKLEEVQRVEILDVCVEADNIRSIKLLTEAGFVQDGVDKEGMLVFKKSKPFT